MKEEQTTTISARVPLTLLSDISQELRATGKRMNQFLTEAIRDKLSSENEAVLDAEILRVETELELLKSRKKSVREKKENLENIPKHELPFLLETKKIIERDPTYLRGRIQLYKNKFSKHFRISEQEFLILLDNVEYQTTQGKNIEQEIGVKN